MNRWGIGTRLFRVTILYAKLAWLYDEVVYATLCAPLLPYFAAPRAAGTLIGCGVVVYAAAIWRIYASIDRGRLETRGVYAFFRHPIYAAWVVFILPGLALLKGTLLFLTVPLMGLLAYRLLITEEERHLLGLHGPDYEAYRRRVGGIFPRLVRLAASPAEAPRS